MSISTNSPKAWWLASRPKTLSGAAVPVCIAWSAAYALQGFIPIFPSVLCLLFALLMQVDANFVNDYFDFKKGEDGADRLGPERACTQGWITPSAMEKGIVFTTLLSALVGLPLVCWGGWEMLIVGILCVLFCFLYTTLLSRIALGDVLVLVFFGLVPVCVTYYLLTEGLTLQVVILGLACGIATDCLLLVNNYRDRDADKSHGKRTLVTLIGAKATEFLYVLFGLIATACVIFVNQRYSFLILIYAGMHIHTYSKMKRIREGRELNKILAHTARNILFYGILTCIITLLNIK